MSRLAKPFLRSATNDDFWRYFGRPAPACWAGIVAEDATMLLGIGGVYRGVDGRWWCALDRAPGVGGLPARRLMHAAAVTLLSAVSEVGLRLVHAIPDSRIAGSAYYLDRLGFTPTGEIYNELAVWAWKSQP